MTVVFQQRHAGDTLVPGSFSIIAQNVTPRAVVQIVGLLLNCIKHLFLSFQVSRGECGTKLH